MAEPVFHFFDDCLPETDQRAYDSIYCRDCSELVHAGNNETMTAWFDTGIGEICLGCVYRRYETFPSVGEAWGMDELEMP